MAKKKKKKKVVVAKKEIWAGKEISSEKRYDTPDHACTWYNNRYETTKKHTIRHQTCKICNAHRVIEVPRKPEPKRNKRPSGAKKVAYQDPSGFP